MTRSHRPRRPLTLVPLPPSLSLPQTTPASFQGQGKTLGTKADDDARKAARLAALEAAQKRVPSSGGSSGASGSTSAASRAAASRAAAGGTQADEMRRQILAEREKRRAAAAAERAARDAAVAADDLDPATEPVRDAIRRVAASPDAERSAGLLLRLLTNVISDPSNPKFRRVRLANEKIAAAAACGDGAGLSLLEAVGFRVAVEPEDEVAAAEAGPGTDPRSAALPPDADLDAARGAARRLATLAPAVAASLGPPRPPPPPNPREPPRGGRRARALVPAERCAASLAELPDEYFQRDAADIQAEFARAQARREREGVLTTRAWKERRARGDEDDAAIGTPATIRVRMPDGTQLEGLFGRREPIAAVRAFVAEHLREQHRTFALSFLNAPLAGDDDAVGGAERNAGAGARAGSGRLGKGYGAVGTVEGAGLVPSALVTCTWTDGGAARAAPALSDALMASATPLE